MPSKWPSIQTRLPPPIMEALQDRAARNGRSIYAETAFLLTEAILPEMLGLLDSPAARKPRQPRLRAVTDAPAAPRPSPARSTAPTPAQAFMQKAQTASATSNSTFTVNPQPKQAQREERKLAPVTNQSQCSHNILRRIGNICAQCGATVTKGKK